MNNDIKIFVGVILITAYVFGTLLFFGTVKDFELNFLNPIHNYKKWSSFNWFGVIVCTLFTNIIWLPYAIGYWLYKLIYFLFTVGRK